MVSYQSVTYWSSTEQLQKNDKYRTFHIPIVVHMVGAIVEHYEYISTQLYDIVS